MSSHRSRLVRQDRGLAGRLQAELGQLGGMESAVTNLLVRNVAVSGCKCISRQVEQWRDLLERASGVCKQSGFTDGQVEHFACVCHAREPIGSPRLLDCDRRHEVALPCRR
jgi:hypothetical protein